MSYITDPSVNEFYDHLTLGIAELLENVPGVRDVELEKRLPCDRMLISSWEQRHSCTLPEDMRHFYAASDGFKLIWNYEYAGEVLPIGNLKINSIMELRRIGGVKPSSDIETPSLLDVELCNGENTPSFGLKSKIFEIDPCQNVGKVCLVYDNIGDEGKQSGPKIWLLDRSYDWHYLADSFSHYFRMMLVHQGLPQWQFKCTSVGLTPWAEQTMVMVAPHLFSIDPHHDSDLMSEMPDNQIDPSVFKNNRNKTVTKRKGEK